MSKTVDSELADIVDALRNPHKSEYYRQPSDVVFNIIAARLEAVHSALCNECANTHIGEQK